MRFRGACVFAPLSAGVSKRTRAIGESRSGPRRDMQKGPDLDKNSPSWHQGGFTSSRRAWHDAQRVHCYSLSAVLYHTLTPLEAFDFPSVASKMVKWENAVRKQ